MMDGGSEAELPGLRYEAGASYVFSVVCASGDRNGSFRDAMWKVKGLLRRESPCPPRAGVFSTVRLGAPCGLISVGPGSSERQAGMGEGRTPRRRSGVDDPTERQARKRGLTPGGVEALCASLQAPRPVRVRSSRCQASVGSFGVRWVGRGSVRRGPPGGCCGAIRGRRRVPSGSRAGAAGA